MGSWSATAWWDGRRRRRELSWAPSQLFSRLSSLPEAGVGVLRDDGLLADHFQLWHPTGGQVAVLQHHPGAFLDGLVDHLGRDGPLALSQGYGLRLATPHLQVISKLQQAWKSPTHYATAKNDR